jgi:hypothetical protein
VNQTPVLIVFQDKMIIETAIYGSDFMIASEAIEKNEFKTQALSDGHRYKWPCMDVCG